MVSKRHIPPVGSNKSSLIRLPASSTKFDDDRYLEHGVFTFYDVKMVKDDIEDDLYIRPNLPGDHEVRHFRTIPVPHRG